MRGGRMSPFTNDFDGESVCSGQSLSFMNPNFPDGKKRTDMCSEDRIHLWVLQNPFLHHHPSTSTTFFSRLEDPFDISLHLIFHRRKEFRYTQKDGHMSIVTTGMHLPL